MITQNITAKILARAIAVPEAPMSKGKLSIGFPETQYSYDPATHFAYARRLRIFGNGLGYGIDLKTGFTFTDDGSAYVPPVAQVETATAAGTITTSGNAVVTVTAAGLTGSPLAISVPVVTGDTAAVWAGKVRAALAAHAAIKAMFTVGGTSTAITLTRIVNDVGYANDATLNIALADGTSAGITEAASSANTTAGAVATGHIWENEDGVDAEGYPFPFLDGEPEFLLIQGVRGNTEVTTYTTETLLVTLGPGDTYLRACPSEEIGFNDLEFQGGVVSEIRLFVVMAKP